MTIHSQFPDYYDNSLKAGQTYHYDRIMQAFIVRADRELPLEFRKVEGVTLADFTVYFCGKFYSGIRVVHTPTYTNTCVYTQGIWTKFCPRFTSR